MRFARPQHIVVEGPPGAGKRAVCEHLARQLGARAMLEDPASNRWQSRLAADAPRWALPAHLETLRHHETLLAQTADQLNQGNPVVNDFLIERDRRFALTQLPEEERDLYAWVFTGLQTAQPVPDLLIGLLPPRQPGDCRDPLGEVSAPLWQSLLHDFDLAPKLLVQAESWIAGERASDLALLDSALAKMRGRIEVISIAD